MTSSLRLTDLQKANMDARGDRKFYAYYFSFEETGVPEIDYILTAVARAGKHAHHTQWWDDELAEERGGTPVAHIQAAANSAADHIKELSR